MVLKMYDINRSICRIANLTVLKLTQNQLSCFFLLRKTFLCLLVSYPWLLKPCLCSASPIIFRTSYVQWVSYPLQFFQLHIIQDELLCCTTNEISSLLWHVDVAFEGHQKIGRRIFKLFCFFCSFMPTLRNMMSSLLF